MVAGPDIAHWIARVHELNTVRVLHDKAKLNCIGRQRNLLSLRTILYDCCQLMMPTTRTSARLATRTLGKSSSGNRKGCDAPVAAVKRKAVEERSEKPDDSVRKRARKGASGIPAPTITPTQPHPMVTPKDGADALVPATLTFSLEKAKEHLIRADHRFEDIFDKMPCKPYENLEQFHPFRLVLH